MELKYVSPEYQKQLDDLAETLMKRFAPKIGQLALFESDATIEEQNSLAETQ